MTGIDRMRVRNAFDHHAREYEGHANVQRRVASNLASALGGDSSVPQRILDVGAGTGLLLRLLAGRYPDARLVGLDLAFGMSRTAREQLWDTKAAQFLTGDAERLPCAAGSFDLVVSTSTFQWLERLELAFAEIHRVLVPGGCFSFALFGEQTLYELRDSYVQAQILTGHGRESRTMPFFAVASVEAALVRSGFAGCRVYREREREFYPDVVALLRAVRGVGAATTSPVSNRGLSERRVMLTMMEIYRQEYGKDGRIPATYDVIYGVGRKL